MKIFEYGKENREVILFLHGGGLSWWNYRDEARLLQDEYHVVIPVLDGHGGSDAPFTSIEKNAAELIEYIDKNYGGKVKLIGGLSLGAQILIEMLSQKRDVCDYAVIESASIIPEKIPASILKASLNMSYGLIKHRHFSELQFKSLKIRMDLFEDYYKDTCRIEKADLVSFMEASSYYVKKTDLNDSRVEALILAGGREQKKMIRSAEILKDTLLDSRLQVLEGYSHGELSLNHPEDYAAMIRDFMKKERPLLYTEQ
jgi:pimeloyl-ACP methyl ester carboxylesterase